MFVQVNGNCCDLPQDSFYHRVRHNFKIYVLLGLKEGEWNREDILSKIYKLSGYRSHRIIKYKTKWSHLNVKFASAHDANEAVKYFRQLSPDLSVELIENMLEAWYQFEKESGHNQTLTHGIVDIIGSPPYGLNMLTERVINEVFIDYGAPYLLPYTAALSEKHVQLVFKSMTEALAACMAFGEWFRRDEKCDLFYYRVRINPGAYEASLIESSNGIPEEAFKLEYFVYVKTDSKSNPTNRKKCEKSTQFPSNSEQNRLKCTYKNDGNLQLNNRNLKRFFCISAFPQPFTNAYNTNFTDQHLSQMQSNLALYYQDFPYVTGQRITDTGLNFELHNEFDYASEAGKVSEEASAQNFLPERHCCVGNNASLPNKHLAMQPRKTHTEESEPPIQPQKTHTEENEPPIQPQKTPTEESEHPIRPERTPKEAKEKRATSKKQGAFKGSSRMPERVKPT